MRETFGALVATVQGGRATEGVVAKAMRVIAEDETRHAALAWDVAQWVEGRLSDAERVRVNEARREAIETLRRELATSPSDALVDRAGMPDAKEAGRLLDALESTLWTA